LPKYSFALFQSTTPLQNITSFWETLSADTLPGGKLLSTSPWWTHSQVGLGLLDRVPGRQLTQYRQDPHQSAELGEKFAEN